MKRTLMTIAAAASLLLASCGSNGGNNANGGNNGAATETKAAAEEFVLPVDPSAKLDKTFDHEKFTVQYPSTLEPQTTLGSDLSFATPDGSVKITGTYNTEGVAVADLASMAENMKAAAGAMGETAENPIVKGKAYVIKSKTEDKVIYHYCVMKEDKVGIMGDFEMENEAVAEYEKYVGAVLSSIKFK